MPSVRRVVETLLPTRHGLFRIVAYDSADGKEHLALTVGAVGQAEAILVRLHSECLTGDVFGSCRCDCGEQLDLSLALLQERGQGILLYLRQEGRGIGLTNKLRAYELQDWGYDTVDANRALGFPDDLRDYGPAAEMLLDLGVDRVRLLTNNPAKIEGLERHGITVVERVSMPVQPNPANLRYLRTKEERMGHLFTVDDGLVDSSIS